IGDLRLYGSLAVKDLNSFVPRVGNIHVALRVDREAMGGVELARIAALRSPGLHKLAVSVELGDSRVSKTIRDVNVSRAIPRHIGWSLKNVTLSTSAGRASSPTPARRRSFGASGGATTTSSSRSASPGSARSRGGGVQRRRRNPLRFRLSS